MAIELGSFSLGVVAGGLVVGIANHFLAKSRTIEDRNTKAFNVAAERFRDAFTEEIASIQSRTQGTRPDNDEILEAAFQKHLRAINEFRRFISEQDISAFNEAWDEYHTVDGEHYLKQYAE